MQTVKFDVNSNIWLAKLATNHPCKILTRTGIHYVFVIATTESFDKFMKKLFRSSSENTNLLTVTSFSLICDRNLAKEMDIFIRPTSF